LADSVRRLDAGTRLAVDIEHPGMTLLANAANGAEADE
jgi:hypothetical protein